MTATAKPNAKQSKKDKFDAFNKRSRDLIKLANILHNLGAHFDLRIPGIIVCGNQSAGKSSLIESITRVPLPRSDGTCTRCPIECCLSETAEKWRCMVSIRYEFDDETGARLEEPTKVDFGGVIGSISDVEERVRRAQIAVLNPRLAPDTVLLSHDLTQITNELKFTENVVCLSIEGPNVGNLTLVDLPGLIQCAEDDEKRFIDMIKKMVKRYMDYEANIIVEAITCKDDLENQVVHMLAKEADPAGRRTIGVLTKPDTIEEGCHAPWIRLLRNETRSLTHGYFIVKNPAQAELLAGIQFDQARVAEAKFFKTLPWLDEKSCQSKYGVDNLKDYLCKVLTEMLDKNIPIIRKDANAKLAAIEMQLQEMPQEVESPAVELLMFINQFLSEITVLVKDTSPKTFWHQEREVFREFKAAIKKTAPKFIVNSKTNWVPQEGDSDDEAIDTDTADDAGTIHQMPKFTVEQVKKIIDDNKGREIPGVLASAAVFEIVSCATKLWKAPTLACFDEIESIMESHFVAQLEKHFGRFANLKDYFMNAVLDVMKKCHEEFSVMIQRKIAAEQVLMFTMNDHYLEVNYNKLLAQLREAASPDSSEQLGKLIQDAKHVSKTLCRETGDKLIKGLENVCINSIPLDDDEALCLMARSKAYWRVAYKRFVDCVILEMEYDFVFRVVEDVQKCLMIMVSKLCQGSGEDILMELFSEDTHLAKARKELQDQKKRLKATIRAITASMEVN